MFFQLINTRLWNVLLYFGLSIVRRPARPFKNEAEAEEQKKTKKKKNIAKRWRKPKVVLPFLHFDERTNDKQKIGIEFQCEGGPSLTAIPLFVCACIYIRILRRSTSSAIQMRVRQLKATITAIEWKRKIVTAVFFFHLRLYWVWCAFFFLLFIFFARKTKCAHKLSLNGVANRIQMNR